MLVLSRKSGQKLIMANGIEITILETRGDTVKIGIQAPKDVWVYREEVYEEILRANTQAKEAPPASDALDAASGLAKSANPRHAKISLKRKPPHK